MLEKTIEAKLKQALEARGALVYKFVSPGNAGVPDRVVVLPDGRAVFIELKQETGRLRKLQWWQKKRLLERNAAVYVVRGPEEADALITHLFPPAHRGGGAR